MQTRRTEPVLPSSTLSVHVIGELPSFSLRLPWISTALRGFQSNGYSPRHRREWKRIRGKMNAMDSGHLPDWGERMMPVSSHFLERAI